MHYTYFVTMNKQKASTSHDARKEIGYRISGLSQDSSSSYHVGGSRSGFLVPQVKQFLEEVEKCSEIEHEIDPAYKAMLITPEEVARKKTILQKIWRNLGGYSLNPYLRDRSRPNGYEDDAMIITPELYQNFMLHFEKATKGKNSYYRKDFEKGYWVDVEGDSVSKKFIGTKWLVFVDCHC